MPVFCPELRGIKDLEQFQEKWTLVFRPELLKIKNLDHF